MFFKYNIWGYDKEGYNRKGFDKHGFDKNGYDINGYDLQGFDKNGFDRNGFDRCGFDKNGYDVNGYNLQGFDKNGFDRNGFDRCGFDKNGYNAQGFDKNGLCENGTYYDDNGYNIDGYDKYGFDKEGFDRFRYDKYGFNKEGLSKYGWDRNGFNKKQQYCELIGKEVVHSSCGKGIVVDFYSTDDVNRFVVEYKNKSQGKFIFSEKVLKILDFGNFSPNFEDLGYYIERTYDENSDIEDKPNNSKSYHESRFNFDTYYDFSDTKGLPTWNENYEMDEDKQYKSEYIDMIDSANDSGWFYDDNDD